MQARLDALSSLPLPLEAPADALRPFVLPHSATFAQFIGTLPEVCPIPTITVTDGEYSECRICAPGNIFILFETFVFPKSLSALVNMLYLTKRLPFGAVIAKNTDVSSFRLSSVQPILVW
jgi:hypothetical protein